MDRRPQTAAAFTGFVAAVTLDVYDGYGVAWSENGIAFAGQANRRSTIQVLQPDGSGLHSVTSPPKHSGDSRPAWSTDGRQLAFMRGGGGPRSSDGVVYVTSVAGGTPRRVGPGTAPAWSPHGRYLAYADSGNNPASPSAALHISDRRSPSRRVRLPSGLATFGFVDQLTWLP